MPLTMTAALLALPEDATVTVPPSDRVVVAILASGEPTMLSMASCWAAAASAAPPWPQVVPSMSRCGGVLARNPSAHADAGKNRQGCCGAQGRHPRTAPAVPQPCDLAFRDGCGFAEEMSRTTELAGSWRVLRMAAMTSAFRRGRRGFGGCAVGQEGSCLAEAAHFFQRLRRPSGRGAQSRCAHRGSRAFKA